VQWKSESISFKADLLVIHRDLHASALMQETRTVLLTSPADSNVLIRFMIALSGKLAVYSPERWRTVNNRVKELFGQLEAKYRERKSERNSFIWKRIQTRRRDLFIWQHTTVTKDIHLSGGIFFACPGFFPFDPFLYCLNPFVLHVTLR
jgi:hypothetical protein